MTKKGTSRSGQTKLKDQKIKALEAALRDERLALIAISTAFLRETPDPPRLIARLEAMARQAARPEAKLSPRTRTAFVKGYQMIRRAAAVELSKPQPLFDGVPNPGHPDPEKVQKLADPEQEQMGMASGDGELADVEEAQDERAVHVAKLDAMVLNIVERFGPCDDGEIYRRYADRPDRTPMTEKGLRQHRQDMVVRRLLARAGKDKRNKLLFDLPGRDIT